MSNTTKDTTGRTQDTRRDNLWLEARLRHLWDTYYHDVPVGYPIQARFGRFARYRYGSIYSSNRQCCILINGLFAHRDVPEYVVDATLAHELAHYVHGYGSGLRRLHAHPHRGGVVDEEMKKRGCFFLEVKAAAWRKSCWPEFYAEHSPDTISRLARREEEMRRRWEAYLSTPGFRTEAVLQARLHALAPTFGLDAPPFEIAWLRASLRRTGLSYLFRKEASVRLHGLLADSRVPDVVIDYELCYWLAVHTAGDRWANVERAMQQANVWKAAQEAIKWRRKVWPRYRVANHPLAGKRAEA